MHLKQYEIVINQDRLTVDLQETLMNYKTIKEWAYILHDKDDTRPHYHIYVNFGGQGCDSALLAKWFEIPENLIEKVKGRKTDMLLYLTHGNDSQRHKYQYNPADVVSNFAFDIEIEKSRILGDFKKYSYAQQLAYVNSLPVGDKAKSFSQLKKLWELECQSKTLETDRNITVVFVCGPAGKGKTYYSKKMLTSMGLDFCISSSSNDPFQDYLGQKAIILDDLRDSSFELADLLKILDNNTSSSVKSRFANKVFNGEIIVITSSVPLCYWYARHKYNSNDTLDQLYRRISNYVVVTESEVTVYNRIDNFGKPVGRGYVYKNELVNLKKELSKEKVDIKSTFDQFCESVGVKDCLCDISQDKLPF